MIQVSGKTNLPEADAARNIFHFLLKRRVMAGKGQVRSYFKIVRRPREGHVGMKHKRKRRKPLHNDVVSELNHHAQVRFNSRRVLQLVRFGFPCSLMERKYL